MVQFEAKQIYDPTTGEMLREVKSSDLFHLATAGQVAATAGSVIAQTTTTANKDLFLTGYIVSAAQATTIYVRVDSSTILPVYLGDNTRLVVMGSINDPLYKAGGATSQTIAIVSYSASTCAAFLAGVYHPIPSKLETA